MDSDWYKSQTLAMQWLRNHGLPAKQMGYRSPFDLYTDNGARIEVKHSPFRRLYPNNDYFGWFFNIHRHGTVANKDVDFYILRCETSKELRSIGWVSAVHLVIPAPLARPTISVSLRSMATKYAQYFNDLKSIKEFKNGNSGN